MSTAKMKKKKPVAREVHCRICGCTYMRPCPGGCGWVEGDLCSICSAFRDQLTDYIEFCYRVSARSLNRLLREAA